MKKDQIIKGELFCVKCGNKTFLDAIISSDVKGLLLTFVCECGFASGIKVNLKEEVKKKKCKKNIQK